jgi:CrcB protein
MSWLMIGIGGAAGAIARHGLNTVVHRWWPSATFPWGIFVVNVTGCAAIGLVAGMIAAGRLHVEPETRLLLVVGVLGGFTTFSSFGLDTLMLIRAGHTGLALANVGGQVGLSLLAVAVGFRLGT